LELLLASVGLALGVELLHEKAALLAREDAFETAGSLVELGL
jgi:hypothetical protein